MKTEHLFTKQTNPPSQNNTTVIVFVCFFILYALGSLFSIDNKRITNSHESYDYTSVNDKISCVRVMYKIHLTFCWLTFLSGLFAIGFRIYSYLYQFKFWNQAHKWAGRSYLLNMMWTIATSGLIRNEGLPLGTLVSFLWVLGGLTFGYILIKINSHTRWVRITHGALMVTSWVGIAGRIFNYNTGKDFTCYTYPVFKSNLTLLPASDPNYDRMPWANKEIWEWGLPLLIGPFFGTYLLAWYSVP